MAISTKKGDTLNFLFCSYGRYVEAFDQETMLEMTRVVSAEGAALVEAQTSALFGDLKSLQRQMQVHLSSWRCSPVLHSCAGCVLLQQTYLP